MNKLLVILCLLIVTGQGFIIYKQNQKPVARPKQEAATDAKPNTYVDLKTIPTTNPGKVALVEFSDFECPYCKRYAADTSPKLRAKFGTTSGVSFAFANNPLPMHKTAEPLALASLCADNQGKFLAMHDTIFTAKITSIAEATAVASTIGINLKKFEKCLTDTQTKTRLDSQMKIAKDLGFSGTPMFGLGVVGADGRVLLKRIVNGAQPAEVFEREIGAVLAAAKI